jgi:gluconolactonase
MKGLFISAMLLVGVATSTFAAEIEVINDKAAFPEGPVVVEGKLYYTEYGGNTLLVWENGKTTKLWEQAGCGPSAVIPLGDDLAVTCYDAGSIARVSKEGKTVATYDKAGDGSPLVGPNDFSSDGKSGLYFTASGPWEPGPIVGKVFHLDAGGTIKEIANDLHYPNGIVLSKDGSRLFVNESEAGRVISFAVGTDGTLSDRRLFVRVGVVDEASGIGAYPDGIKLGPDGNFYIAQYSKGRIVVVDGEGKFVKAIDVPSATAPNLAFSEDGKTAFITAVDDTVNAPYWGKVYKVPLD